MRRSLEPRVKSQGELLFQLPDLGPRTRAAIVNLSRNGVCATGRLPQLASDRSLIQLALGLADGTPPITASARVAWVEAGGDASGECTFGLCFVDLSGQDRARLGEVVQAARESTPSEDSPRPVRLKLEGGPTLRALAESADDRGVVLGAELSWLRVGGEVEAELDERVVHGRIEWVGLDVAASGAAQLRLRVGFHGKDRRDITLPYFSTAAQRDAAPSSDDEPGDALRALTGGDDEQRDAALRRLRAELGRRGDPMREPAAQAASRGTASPYGRDEGQAASRGTASPYGRDEGQAASRGTASPYGRDEGQAASRGTASPYGRDEGQAASRGTASPYGRDEGQAASRGTASPYGRDEGQAASRGTASPYGRDEGQAGAIELVRRGTRRRRRLALLRLSVALLALSSLYLFARSLRPPQVAIERTAAAAPIVAPTPPPITTAPPIVDEAAPEPATEKPPTLAAAAAKPKTTPKRTKRRAR